MSTQTQTLLEARQLACRRGRNLLFEGLDLGLRPGSVTWLRGTNGSGKTSLMRILAGLSAPESGSKSPKWLSSLLPTGRSRLIG
mgnify:CR=1 FL=1